MHELLLDVEPPADDDKIVVGLPVRQTRRGRHGHTRTGLDELSRVAHHIPIHILAPRMIPLVAGKAQRVDKQGEGTEREIPRRRQCTTRKGPPRVGSATVITRFPMRC